MLNEVPTIPQRADVRQKKMVVSSSFWEKQLHLEAKLPVGATLVGRHHVAVGCQLRINR